MMSTNYEHTKWKLSQQLHDATENVQITIFPSWTSVSMLNNISKKGQDSASNPMEFRSKEVGLGRNFWRTPTMPAVVRMSG